MKRLVLVLLLAGCAQATPTPTTVVAPLPPVPGGVVAGSMPEWKWSKLVLVLRDAKIMRSGKEYVVEMIDRDPKNALYLTTPWPGYPPCDGKCLTVIKPNGQIVKVIKAEERDKWREASNWDKYAYISSGWQATTNYPVVIGDKLNFTARYPVDGRDRNFYVELTVVGRETVKIPAGTLEVIMIENRIRDDTGWKETRHLYFDPATNLGVKWDGSENPWELKEYVPLLDKKGRQ